jgi:L-lysine 6-transaminase
VIEADDLFENAAAVGRYLQARLAELADDFPTAVLDIRGRGLMCAFSMPTTQDRDALIRRLWHNGTIVLPSGQTSVRFRPALTVAHADVDEAVAALRDALAELIFGSGPCDARMVYRSLISGYTGVAGEDG